MAVKALASAIPAGTVLAFDFGTQRIGVAVGETSLGVAHPLTTLASRGKQHFDSIAALVAEWHPVLLLVGLPTHADGTPHVMTARARRFATELRRRFGLPVAFGDERFITLEASSRSRESKAKARREMRDSLAAQIILQAYLDQYTTA
ncbi:MAG TPA: Holliday junction resolvase RuvX [Casimicrobiaceae bacterium]|nr:Holliday junction resolvase RuvX [Casimicrobiaceae bacterium]